MEDAIESTSPLLRRALIGLAVFTVLLLVVGNLYRTPLKTMNVVNETTETLTITTTIDKKVRVFSAPSGGRVSVPLTDQSQECSPHSMKLRTPSQRSGEISGEFCQDENHPVRESDLVASS
ncbi:MAG: hypothetical protein GX593_08865 [Actinomycetales bacterium]|nr:hypothetical protein [Actinomycetales bacterium]